MLIFIRFFFGSFLGCFWNIIVSMFFCKVGGIVICFCVMCVFFWVYYVMSLIGKVIICWSSFFFICWSLSRWSKCLKCFFFGKFLMLLLICRMFRLVVIFIIVCIVVVLLRGWMIRFFGLFWYISIFWNLFVW